MLRLISQCYPAALHPLLWLNLQGISDPQASALLFLLLGTHPLFTPTAPFVPTKV